VIHAFAQEAQLGNVRPADRPALRLCATRMECATRRRSDQAGRLSWDRLEPFLVRVEPCEAAQQTDGVRVARRIEDREVHPADEGIRGAGSHADRPGGSAEVVGLARTKRDADIRQLTSKSIYGSQDLH